MSSEISHQPSAKLESIVLILVVVGSYRKCSKLVIELCASAEVGQSAVVFEILVSNLFFAQEVFLKKSF